MGTEAAIQIFDELRSARLYRRYYEARLRAAQRVVFWSDMLTAVAASGLGVGLWLLPSGPISAVVMKSLVLIAAAFSLYQLIAKPGERMAAFEAYLAVYEQLDWTLNGLVRRIKVGDWDLTFSQRLEEALNSNRSVHLRRVEAGLDERLLESLQDRVNKELPADYFK